MFVLPILIVACLLITSRDKAVSLLTSYVKPINKHTHISVCIFCMTSRINWRREEKKEKQKVK